MYSFAKYPAPKMTAGILNSILRTASLHLSTMNETSHRDSQDFSQTLVTSASVTLDNRREIPNPFKSPGLHCGQGDLLGPLGLLVQGILAFIAFASLIGTSVTLDNRREIPNPFKSPELHCGKEDLLGPFGLLMQGILAFIAFASLIVKRFCEPKPERRPWKIWFFDTSKQAIGAAVIHFANVFLASMFSGDPCTWYIVSFLLDSTIGLLIIYIGLKITQYLVVKMGNESLLFGEYGSPPQCHAWAGQCGLYILVMLIEKTLMTLLVLPDFWQKVRKFIMYPIKDPNLELIIVMFIVPFIMNAFIFWVVDNFLKKKKWKKVHAPINSNESAMKYFSAFQKVKYYDNIQCAEDSESDILLSHDEESGPRGKVVRTDSSTSCGGVQYSLLAPANT